MAQQPPTIADSDTLSSISLFIGIPTQEHRSVQGNLAGLIGSVLRIAHKCHERNDESEKLSYSYTPLIEGASAYISVFGHFVSKQDDWRRVDDHSEVVEFFTSPEEYYPTLLVVLCEVAYPALVLANQNAILILLRHQGRNDRVMLWRQGDITATSRPKSVSPAATVNEVDDHPIRSLRHLLSTLYAQADTSEDSRDDWFHLDTKNGSLFRGLIDGWPEWLRKHPYELRYNNVPAERDYFLPTIRIRILLDLSCWWLFYAASNSIKGANAQPSSRETIAEEDYDLWSEDAGERMSSLLESELTQLETTYFATSEKAVELRDWGFESEDPLSNAMLWLAFVRDFIAYSVNTSAPVKKAQPSRDPLDDLRFEEKRVPSTRTKPIYTLTFDKYVNAVLPAYVKRPNGGNPSDIGYWKTRLDLLEKLNDRYFPDHHLLSAWKLLLDLIRSPRISLGIAQDIGSDAGYSVEWAAWLSNSEESQGLDMWVRLNRTIRESPAITRFWTAPLMVEAVFAFATLGGRKEEWDFASYPSLRSRLEALYPIGRHGLNIIQKIAQDATAAYPIKLPKPAMNSSSVSRFIYYMQSGWII